MTLPPPHILRHALCYERSAHFCIFLQIFAHLNIHTFCIILACGEFRNTWMNCVFAHLEVLICVHLQIPTFFLEGRCERFAERTLSPLELYFDQTDVLLRLRVFIQPQICKNSGEGLYSLEKLS